jgi:hypothetical protein
MFPVVIISASKKLYSRFTGKTRTHKGETDILLSLAEVEAFRTNPDSIVEEIPDGDKTA